VVWSLGLFGLLRLNWFEQHALLPFTRLQGRLGASLCNAPANAIDATLACSGADVMALCLGAVLAYPTRWRMRLAGATGGLILILALNTLRLGTLGLVVSSPAWFEILHIYVWPAALILAVAGYVFAWMRCADSRPGLASRVRASSTRPATPSAAASPTRLTLRFVIATAAFLVLFTAASPLYLENTGVLAVASFIARAAAAVLHGFGVDARAGGNVLWTARGVFAVTQECISTPLIPVYLAAIVAYATTWRQRALGLAATIPLFVGLGIARLLVVALPAALVTSPLYLVHAFYQLLLGAAVVVAAAYWRHGAAGGAMRHAFGAMALGVAVASFVGVPIAHLSARVAELIDGATQGGVVASLPLDDSQGAIAAFASVGWRRFVAGLALLALLQVASAVALHELGGHIGFVPRVPDVRAWALVGPLLVIAAVVTVARLHRPRALTGGAAGVGTDEASSTN
jgi:exosortase/archaeosortase family protein